MNYNISINPELARIVDREMKRGAYANRSEFFRELVRRTYMPGHSAIEQVLPGDPDYAAMKQRIASKDTRRYSLKEVRSRSR